MKFIVKNNLDGKLLADSFGNIIYFNSYEDANNARISLVSPNIWQIIQTK